LTSELREKLAQKETYEIVTTGKEKKEMVVSVGCQVVISVISYFKYLNLIWLSF